MVQIQPKHTVLYQSRQLNSYVSSLERLAPSFLVFFLRIVFVVQYRAQDSYLEMYQASSVEAVS